jgi:DNA-binding LytR/AlgR family response regulator
MVLKLEQKIKQNDVEILITYSQKNQYVERLVSLINSADMQMPCYSKDELILVNASDILFIERTVDKKTMVNCEKSSYQSKEWLYQIFEKLRNIRFVQINKYCILNLNKLIKIKQLPNSHMEAVLSNGKSLYVTRKYLIELKRILMEKR